MKDSQPDTPEIIETDVVYIPASELSWSAILSHWQGVDSPPCTLSLNNKPLDGLIAALDKGDVIGLLKIVYTELLTSTEAETKHLPQIQEYLALVNQYNIPDDIFDSNRYIFHQWVSKHDAISKTDRLTLLNPRLRYNSQLYHHINDEKSPLCQYLSFYDVLRTHFNHQGKLHGWHHIIRERLDERDELPSGAWSVTFNLTSLPDGKIKLSEYFSYGDSPDNIHFCGRYEFEFLLYQAGVKGRCSQAQLTVYNNQLIPAIQQPCLVESILKDHHDLKNQLSHIDSSAPIFLNLEARSIVSRAAVDYLTQAITSTELVQTILDNPGYISGNRTNKTLNFLYQMTEEADFPILQKIPIVLQHIGIKLTEIEEPSERTPLLQTIDIVKGMEKFLTKKITKFEFETIVANNRLYVEAKKSVKLTHLIKQILSEDNQTLLENIKQFSLQNNAMLSDEDKQFLTHMETYLNHSLTALELCQKALDYDLNKENKIASLFYDLCQSEPSLILSLFYQKSSLSNTPLKQENLEQKVLEEQSNFLDSAIYYLAGKTPKKVFLNKFNKITLEEQPEDIKNLLDKVLAEKSNFILTDIDNTLKIDTLTEADKTLLQQASLYLEDKIQMDAFQIACMNHPESTEKYRALLNAVVEEKPMLDASNE